MSLQVIRGSQRSRIGLLVVFAALSVLFLSHFAGFSTAKAADQARKVRYDVDSQLPHNATAVKRFANCAVSSYVTNDRSGSEITDCDNADLDDQHDYVTALTSRYVSAFARRVEYRSDQSCPDKEGKHFDYVKCFYTNGKNAGSVVMTVAYDVGLEAAKINITWYSL